MSNKMQKLKLFAKSFLTATLCSAMLVTAFPILSHAESAKTYQWNYVSGGTYQLMGSDVYVTFEEDCVTFSGNGAIPDFNSDIREDRSIRPWHGSQAHYIKIGEGITYIGKDAFSLMEKVEFVTMYSTTFISDSSIFYHTTQEPIVRVMGDKETIQMIGTIPYSSLDSIAALAQASPNGERFIFDNNAIVTAFKNRTNPQPCNVWPADYKIEKDDDGNKKEAPWRNVYKETKNFVFTNLCKLSPTTPNASYVVTGEQRIQGIACYQAFAAFIGTDVYRDMFRLNVTKGDTIITDTKNPYTYVWTIPEKDRVAGKTYKMLALGKGTVNTFMDEDTDPNTFTMTTSTPSNVYCLVTTD